MRTVQLQAHWTENRDTTDSSLIIPATRLAGDEENVELAWIIRDRGYTHAYLATEHDGDDHPSDYLGRFRTNAAARAAVERRLGAR